MSDKTVVKAPAAKEIDALILKYDGLQRKADRAGKLKKLRDENANRVKAELIAMVEANGVKHAEKSRRLAGNHNTATITIGHTTVVVDGAVEMLKGYVEKSDVPGLSERFFIRHVTYQLVESPADVLKTVEVAKRIRTKLETLVALCFTQKAKAPSLKIDVVTPGK